MNINQIDGVDMTNAVEQESLMIKRDGEVYLEITNHPVFKSTPEDMSAVEGLLAKVDELTMYELLDELEIAQACATIVSNVITTLGDISQKDVGAESINKLLGANVLDQYHLGMDVDTFIKNAQHYSSAFVALCDSIEKRHETVSEISSKSAVAINYSLFKSSENCLARCRANGMKDSDLGQVFAEMKAHARASDVDMLADALKPIIPQSIKGVRRQLFGCDKTNLHTSMAGVLQNAGLFEEHPTMAYSILAQLQPEIQKQFSEVDEKTAFNIAGEMVLIMMKRAESKKDSSWVARTHLSNLSAIVIGVWDYDEEGQPTYLERLVKQIAPLMG